MHGADGWRSSSKRRGDNKIQRRDKKRSFFLTNFSLIFNQKSVFIYLFIFYLLVFIIIAIVIILFFYLFMYYYYCCYCFCFVIVDIIII